MREDEGCMREDKGCMTEIEEYMRDDEIGEDTSGLGEADFLKNQRLRMMWVANLGVLNQAIWSSAILQG